MSVMVPTLLGAPGTADHASSFFQTKKKMSEYLRKSHETSGKRSKKSAVGKKTKRDEREKAQQRAKKKGKGFKKGPYF
jgi:hypothetical protein